jgi:hypothetical protein
MLQACKERLWFLFSVIYPLAVSKVARLRILAIYESTTSRKRSPFPADCAKWLCIRSAGLGHKNGGRGLDCARSRELADMHVDVGVWFLCDRVRELLDK